MMSFPQFLAQHMNRLPWESEIKKTVTLHEACKSAFTGLDLTGARDVLRKLPGINLVEMPVTLKRRFAAAVVPKLFSPPALKP